MNVHILQHAPFEGPAHINSWLTRNSINTSTTHLYSSPQLPDPTRIHGLIILGGPMSVHDTQTHPWLTPEKVFILAAIQSRIPTLGLCLGAQLIAEVLGAQITPSQSKEIGWFPVQGIPSQHTHTLANLLPNHFTPFHWHGETFSLPPNTLQLATSPACPHQAFSYQHHVLGLQFHLETTPDSAQQLIRNCPNDLAPGPYTQSANQILNNHHRFLQANTLMDHILTTLLKPPTP